MDCALHDSFRPVDPAAVALGTDELHVWAVPLRGEPGAMRELLSGAELERASRFHFVDHRRRYVISHGALRQILGGYLGRDPRTLEFGAGRRGKPFLAADGSPVPGPYFNLSHSGQLALIGVAGTELGIDCEKVRPLGSYFQLAEKHFSSAEFARLGEVADDQRLAAFYRCWTRKEAVVKALGVGLTVGLDGFEVSLDEAPALLAWGRGDEDAASWSLLDVSPGPDFAAACALRGEPTRVERYRLDVA